MSWGNVRGQMATTIEALTPTTTRRGGTKYRHIGNEQIEEVFSDRSFVLRMTSPPSHVGQMTSPVRYVTGCEVVLFYERTRLVTEDEDRIAEDIIQIQDALLSVGNHHANFEAIIPIGDVYFTTSIDDVGEGNYQVTLGFSVHHQ